MTVNSTGNPRLAGATEFRRHGIHRILTNRRQQTSSCYTFSIINRMTTPIPTRFSDADLAIIDRLVAEGVGQNRSDVVRQAVGRLDDAVRRERAGQAIADSYRITPQTKEDDELAMASAIAMTEAEPW